MKRETQAGLAALVLSTLLGIGMVEVTLRVIGVGYANAPFESDELLHHVHPASFRFVAYDPGGEYGGHQVQYGPDRLRTTSASEVARNRGSRVLVLGDSFVEALSVADEHTFVDRLNRLQDRAWFVNLGVSRYSPVLSELQFRSLDQDSVPSTVLHLLYRNDLREDAEYLAQARLDGSGVPFAVPGPSGGIVYEILRRSYFLRLVRKAYIQATWSAEGHGIAAGGIAEDNAPLTAETEAALDRLASAAGARRMQYVISCVPSQIRVNGIDRSLEDRFCDSVRGYASRHGIAYIDLYPRFDQAAKKPFFDRDIHFNPYGHELAAAALLEGLTASGLLPAAN